MNTANSLLQQLQQRLLILANIDTQSGLGIDVQTLITLLFEAQQSGDGVLMINSTENALNHTISELSSQCPSLIGSPTNHTPIIIFSPFIAFRSPFTQIQQLAQRLSQRKHFQPPSESALNTINWSLHHGNTLNDEQKIAAVSAASMPFSVITGGAGTGKTTTLTKAIELMLLDNPKTDILLAAPTGKAAQRLNESLSYQLESVHKDIKPSLGAIRAQTLHRLLAISEESGRAYRNERNILPCQVLAIDEASMIGGELLMQILCALPESSKLILLGDANQLPPINAISLFNDISSITPHFSELFTNYINPHINTPLSPSHEDTCFSNQVCPLMSANRFAQQSMIEQSADALLAGSVTNLLTVLEKNLSPISDAHSLYTQLYHSYPNKKEQLLQTLSERIILCANRQGHFGSNAINEAFDTYCQSILSRKKDDHWYEGRSIMIEKNYPELNISNGDIGRCKREQDQWQIHFENDVVIPIDSLPPKYSLAFAITIHKSQGSEYRHVDIVLDQYHKEKPNKLVTKPLVYTALTRAKESIHVYSDKELLISCCHRDHLEKSQSPLLYLLNQM